MTRLLSRYLLALMSLLLLALAPATAAGPASAARQHRQHVRRAQQERLAANLAALQWAHRPLKRLARRGLGLQKRLLDLPSGPKLHVQMPFLGFRPRHFEFLLE